MEQFFSVVRRALLLEEGAWVELRDNASFTGVCAGLVVVVAFLGGLGAYLWGEFNIDSTPDGFFVDTVILGSIFTILLILAWIAVTYLVLTQLFAVTVAPDALFRVFAVALAPLVIGFLVFIPELNFWLALSSIILAFGLISFGLRRAFAVERLQGLLALLAGFAVFVIVMSLLITVDNSFSTGVFIFETSEDAVTKSIGSGTFNLDDLNLDELLTPQPTTSP